MGGPEKVMAKKKNWDRLAEAELDEKEDSNDPVSENTGGLAVADALRLERWGRCCPAEDVCLDLRQCGPGHAAGDDQKLH
jgi:hypothetical protein